MGSILQSSNLVDCLSQMQTIDSLQKSLVLGKIEGRRRGHQRMRWLDGITNALDLKLGRTAGDGAGQGGLVCCSPRGRRESNMTWRLNNNHSLIDQQ